MTVTEQAGLLAGFLDARSHYGVPLWDSIAEAEGVEPWLEVAELYGHFPMRWVVGVEQ